MKWTKKKEPTRSPDQLHLIEPLESRVHLDGSPWAWNATIVNQPQAVSDFPYLTGAGGTIVVLDTGIDESNAGVSGVNVTAWQDYVGSSDTPVDTNGHGTGVAGLIAGNHYDFEGYQDQGVAPGVNLIVLRTDDESDSTTWETQAERISDALTWVIDNVSNYNIVAVNMSTGSDAVFSSPITSDNDPDYAIDETLSSQFATLAGDGIFLGAAAGNDGASDADTVEYPAADPNVYAASSVDSSDDISSFASQGSMVDLLAPGENDIMPYGDISGSSFIDYGSGTSFSIPYMVGTAALLKQINPNFTPAELTQIMQDSGTAQYDSTTDNTFDLLNIDAAIKLAYTDAGNANQSLATATNLAFTDNIAESDGNVSLLYEQDYYKFALDSETNVTFTASTSDNETPPTLELLDSSGQLIESLTNGQTVSDLAAGSYYVRATGGSTTLTGTYGITVTGQSATNNTPETATPIDVSSGYGEADNNTLFSGNTDYYSFTIDAQSTATIHVYSTPDYPDVTLLNSDTSTIASIPSGGGSQTLDAGTYLISVASNSANDETYNVTVSITPGSLTPPGGNATAASIAYDSSGNLYMAYYDSSSQTLQFSQRDTSGNWSNPVTVDSTVGAGTELSIAIAPDGEPGIAYYDSVNANLKYAVYDGTSWNVSTPDYYKTTGLMPSLTYDNASEPLIAYYDPYYGQLRVANEVGPSWGIYVMASGGVGEYPSISYDSAAGIYGVAYESAVNGSVNYAYYYRRGFRTMVIDSSLRRGGSMISLAINPTTGSPAVSFYDVYLTSLDYSRYNGKAWVTQRVTSTRNQGEYSSLSFYNGVPDILYYTPTYGAVDEADPSGKSWALSRVTNGGIDLVQAISPDGTSYDSISWITADGVQIMDFT